jgi:ABC-type nitrate/sulfonate/bicarbonate transport system substrate-binding protein
MTNLSMSRRSMLMMMGGVSGAALLGGCSRDSGATGAAPVATPTGEAPFTSNLATIHTGYDNPNFGHHLSDVVAWEKGWLKQAGFNTWDNKIINDSMPAIIGGGVDWTASDTDGIIPAIVEDNVPVVYLGTRRDNEDMIFGLSPGTTVEKLKAERGFVSGGEVGTRNELLGKMMIRELGLDPENDVRWVAMGGGSDTRLAALLNGQLMGSNLQVRHIKVVEDAGGTIAYRQSRKIAQDGYVVQRDFLEKNRNAVVAYLWATIMAKQFVKDLNTRDEVIEMLNKHDFDFNDQAREDYPADVNTLSADCGFEIPEMEKLWEELGQTGEADPNIDWRSACDLEPMWEAQEAAGLPRRPTAL